MRQDALGVDWRVRCDPGVGAPTVEATTLAEPRPMVDPQRPKGQHDRRGRSGCRGPAPRRDPEEVALELLSERVGRWRIDG